MKTSQRQISGQIVVEYILLLIIAVGLALILTRALVSRSPDSPGLLISKWYKIINFIGSDPIEE
ncbi:MAG: hypothetical protein H6625_04300 [Bdellovibrionaceae bacterium]|nr:hypothetical protein [Pseudobdellovibrionaceae bacterium]